MRLKSHETNSLPFIMETNQHLYNTLHGLLVNNLDFFNRGAMSNSTCARFVAILTVIRDHLETIEVESELLRDIAHLYDVDDDTPGNGFRSYIGLMETFIAKSITLCRNIATKRESVFFRAEKVCRELESCASVFSGFRTGCIYLKKMMANNKEGELFSPDGNMTAQELLDEYGNLDQRGFYGRYLGFYYCESMRRTLLGVSIIMASFSDLYQKSGGALIHAASSVLNGGKYSLYPELRARQIVHVAQNASIEFIKSFWSLSETHLMKQVPSLLCPTPAVNEEIYVPSETLFIERINGNGLQEIPIPTSHLPKSPVRCRLISYTHRQGQTINGRLTRPPSEPSPAILFHCHGGGFISQSPEAHEIYLRDWAKELNVPIFTIDYSLAPQAPFPRALEEVLHTYVWAIQNCHRLGWTGERICVAGDSAGGNLVMGMTLQAIDMGIRIPDSIFCAYTPLILDLIPSPSRLLCVMDPLLPLGFMLSCLDAYAGVNSSMDADEEFKDDTPPQSATSRRRSVIQALDSGINLLMGLKNIDIEDSAVEAGAFFKEEDEDEISDEEEIPILRPGRGRRVSIALDTTVLKTDNHPIFGVIASNANETLVPHAGDYADAFMDKYVNNVTYPPIGIESSFDKDEHLIFDLPNDLNFTAHKTAYQATQGYFQKAVGLVTNNNFFKSGISTATADGGNNLTHQNGAATNAQTQIPWFKESKQVLAKKFKRIRIITRNPYMSPILASDETLKYMPPVFFVSPCYDPTLDDSVMFGKRLKRLNRPVKLDFLDALPHGFLNFQTFSKEAHEGSKLCIERLKEAMGLECNAV